MLILLNFTLLTCTYSAKSLKRLRLQKKAYNSCMTINLLLINLLLIQLIYSHLTIFCLRVTVYARKKNKKSAEMLYERNAEINILS